jgi:hypothetical protein
MYKKISKDDIIFLADNYFQIRKIHITTLKSPTLNFIAAQPGAGKSSIAGILRLELKNRGGYIHVDADRMREVIPIDNDRPTSAETQADAAKLARQLLLFAENYRCNIIQEWTLSGKNIIRHYVSNALKNNYIPHLYVAVAHCEESRVCVYRPYELQNFYDKTKPRFVYDEYQDKALSGFNFNLKNDAAQFHRVCVINRDLQTVFDSLRPNNQYSSPFEALEKARELTPQRMAALIEGWAEVERWAENRKAAPSHLEAIRSHLAGSKASPKMMMRGLLHAPG